MSTQEPQGAVPPPTPGAQGVPPNEPGPKKHRNVWVWVSAAVALVAVGLLIWGLNTQSDLDSAQQEASQSKETASTVASTSKAAYDDLEQELGATSGDLAQTEQDVKDAEQSATKAEQDAAAAKKTADQAKNETDKATAQAEEAAAQAQAEKSKAAIVADCSKAYFSAFGRLFEGESVKAQAAAVKQDLQSIAGECKAAFGGT